MPTYFIHYSGPTVGTDMYELHEDDNEKEAYDAYETTAYEHYEQWVDEDDYDEDGNLTFEIEPDLSVELYDPVEHNGYVDSSDKLYIPTRWNGKAYEIGEE